MPDLTTLKSTIISDGKVDATEVNQLRNAMLADGAINREEANTLFEINDAVTGSNNDPSWPVFFSEAITKHVLEDETTPGVVSDEEAMYLKNRIHKQGNVDAAKRALLERLRANAQEPVPPDLTFMFETYLG